MDGTILKIFLCGIYVYMCGPFHIVRLMLLANLRFISCNIWVITSNKRNMMIDMAHKKVDSAKGIGYYMR